MLKPLSHLKQLEQLDICNCDDINGVALYYIGLIPNLKILRLNRSRKVNLGFNFLKNNLSTIELSFCEIESPAVLTLTHLTSLETLNLMGNRLTDEAVFFLQPLVNLTNLNLSMNPSLNDNCLGFFSFPKLQTLNLSFCEKITVQGLKKINPYINLECVGCDKISSESKNNYPSFLSSFIFFLSTIVISKPVVLLAEDDKVQQKIITRTLQRYNFDVEVAENGEIAFEMYKRDSDKYSLILMVYVFFLKKTKILIHKIEFRTC